MPHFSGHTVAWVGLLSSTSKRALPKWHVTEQVNDQTLRYCLLLWENVNSVKLIVGFIRNSLLASDFFENLLREVTQIQ